MTWVQYVGIALGAIGVIDFVASATATSQSCIFTGAQWACQTVADPSTVGMLVGAVLVLCGIICITDKPKKAAQPEVPQGAA
jgi:uncharacterized membrane protein HdeD (DUF308 family)